MTKIYGPKIHTQLDPKHTSMFYQQCVWCDVVNDFFIVSHVVLGHMTGLLQAFLEETLSELVENVVQWIQRTIWYICDSVCPVSIWLHVCT